MAATLIEKQAHYELEEDDDGHRTYTINHLVKVQDDDGPFTARNVPGLPIPGSIWAFGNDVDPWAYCTFYKKVSPHEEKPGEWPEFYNIEQKFTTKPYKRCQDSSIENPLLEPQKVSGTFEKYQREASLDKDDVPLGTSSQELHVGPKVEVDGNRPTVKISQNVADLELSLMAQMMGRVNDSPLWGLPARCIKVSSASWERLVFGTCNYYYQRSFEFDIAYETFDRRLQNHSSQWLQTRRANKDYGIVVQVVTAFDGTFLSVNVTGGGTAVQPDPDTITLGEPDGTVLLNVLGRGKNGVIKVKITPGNTAQTGAAMQLVDKGKEYVDATAVKTSTVADFDLPVLIGRHIAPDPNEVSSYVKATDRRGRKMLVPLDDDGKPVTHLHSMTTKVNRIYKEANLLLLSIPTSF